VGRNTGKRRNVVSRLRRPSRAAVQALGCALTVAALLVPSDSSDAAARPDGRAYELVSPGAKLGKDVIADNSRVRAAEAESTNSPMAAGFPSLGGFGDVRGTGLAVDYLAEREAQPGTSGWSTHAITPAQEPLSFFAATVGLSPVYEGDYSADLSRGVFRAWSPLGDELNVKDVVNLYSRSDLRDAGAGLYQLLTGASSPLAPSTIANAAGQKPFYAGASADFDDVVYETRLNLTPEALSGSCDNGPFRVCPPKLYESRGGAVRLLAPSPACPGLSGVAASSPCSVAGSGVSAQLFTERVISEDGTRIAMTSPVTATGTINTRAGAVSKLYQLDDRNTATTADDGTVQINTSEKSSPNIAQAARYQTASTSGTRVFFTSSEQLTDTAGSGLYLWERQATSESQSVIVDATGGSFTLSAHTQPTVGSGTLTNGSTNVAAVSGSFTVGQTIAGPGIAAGTTITALGSFSNLANSRLTLSAPATASGVQSLTASVRATTTALPWNASAAQVQSALESLSVVGDENVTVAGGPGDAGGTTPYVVTFVGAWAGVNVAPLTTESDALTGGAATATVVTTRPVRNLTLIGNTTAEGVGVFGASEDGSHIYFSATDQLVEGGPAVTTGRQLFLWQDVDQAPGGRLSFIGEIPGGDASSNAFGRLWPTTPKTSRVTPDGKRLLFQATDGGSLVPNYLHGACSGNQTRVTNGQCTEAYVYTADTSTPLSPDVVCVSCNLSAPAAPGDTLLNVEEGTGSSGATWHLNRAISDDGRRVFFTTVEALVSADTNGVSDAYAYDMPSGAVHLISSGTDGSDSYFMDASASGDDAFFVTRERLVGWDTDQAYDLYDARVGGGFPEPMPGPTACVGDACHGEIPTAPGLAGLGSSTFHGLGNAAARHAGNKKCRRGRVRRKVRGKVRCVRRARRAKRPRRDGTRRTDR
jgi:hypothetical protein